MKSKVSSIRLIGSGNYPIRTMSSNNYPIKMMGK